MSRPSTEYVPAHPSQNFNWTYRQNAFICKKVACRACVHRYAVWPYKRCQELVGPVVRSARLTNVNYSERTRHVSGLSFLCGLSSDYSQQIIQNFYNYLLVRPHIFIMSTSLRILVPVKRVIDYAVSPTQSPPFLSLSLSLFN